MKDFFAYFFGAGTQQEFSLLTVAHIAPILWLVGMIFVIRYFKDRIRRWKREEMVRYVLAFALIISEMSYYWRLVGVTALEPSPVDALPFSVCGWAAIFCSYMVIGKNQTLFDISYFWLLCGSVFALMTPTPLTYTGPTRFRYYQFWAEHTLGYVAIFYMIFVHHMRPTIKSAVKSYVALIILAVIAYWVNSMIPGANYLFLARPEAAPSVLDILPPNFALRTLIMAAVITALYGVAYLPWYLKDKKQAKVTV